MRDILDLKKSDLALILEEMGEKPFRAAQIFKWLHERRAISFDDMSDISKALRQKLSEDLFIGRPEVAEVLSSKKDGTKKFLLKLADGNLIECVFMKYRDWNSACISSQVGCAMGCTFCASTIGGLVRNLRPGEMVSQIYAMEEYTGEKISNVVVMGSGEPLANYDTLLDFISIISDSDGKNMSQRNITVSTCGLAPKIRELAEEKLQINLALSLHAPNDGKRRALMPVASRYPMKEVMDAVRFYYTNTHRRLTFEYALVSGKNDSAKDAEELAALLKGINGVVNLIPVNPIDESGYERPAREACLAFRDALTSYGISATVRRELGSDINSACGQLRAGRMGEHQLKE